MKLASRLNDILGETNLLGPSILRFVLVQSTEKRQMNGRPGNLAALLYVREGAASRCFEWLSVFLTTGDKAILGETAVSWTVCDQVVDRCVSA